MTKLNLFLILLLGGMLTFVRLQDASAEKNSVELVKIEPTITVIPSPTPMPVGIPVTIQIPKIQVNASVEPVGVDFQGKMTMPGDWDKTAWYNGPGGIKPSEKGNSVIAGHLDTIYGTTGQFYLLNQVEVGDTVSVTDEFSLVHTFQVFEKQTYKYDDVPLNSVFGKTDEKHLNLITCTGVYIQSLHTYTHRLVVYTKLIE